MAGLYAADGSINITVVDGTTYTGLYAADGSWNVVEADGTTYVGSTHPCGALWVTVAPEDTIVSRQAPDGSIYIAEDPYNPSGALRVTAVSGGFGPRIVLDNLDVDEDASIGDLVGTFSIANAEDNWLDPITYTLLDDAGGLFAIDGDDLEVDASLSPGTYNIEVEADNGTDSPITRIFTITVNTVIVPPTGASWARDWFWW